MTVLFILKDCEWQNSIQKMCYNTEKFMMEISQVFEAIFLFSMARVSGFTELSREASINIISENGGLF